MGSVITLDTEVRDAILKTGGIDAYKCYQCGKCMSVCPWYQVKTVEFPVYRIPQAVKLGVTISSEVKEEVAKEVEEIFRCVGCEACTDECPHGVSIPNIMRAIRRILVDYGTLPHDLKAVISRIYNVGNPFGEPREKRGNWAHGLDIPAFRQDMEFLYFSCCIPAYDTRAKNVAQSTVKILKSANVSFGILGQEEQCCCESIRRAGAEKVFKELAKSNITAFKKAGVHKILTTSPHCYSTFKKEYTEFGANFEVLHQTQLFSQLIKSKRLIPQKPLNKRVAYHDPCTLGRQNGIYDEPREVLKSIPGLELVEIPNFSREYSLCCGGGGIGLWHDWPIVERIADVRVKQVLGTGAEILAVACPYCLQMFEDSIKTMNAELQVMDIAELLADAL
ncbi:MAG: (Fe-S)-binding protein [bacterium]|nr:(Fe-S)-binding protein [bacterium]